MPHHIHRLQSFNEQIDTYQISTTNLCYIEGNELVIRHLDYFSYAVTETTLIVNVSCTSQFGGTSTKALRSIHE